MAAAVASSAAGASAMTLEKRGVQHLKTLAGIVDGRRNRTTAGALLELSMLAMEKQRLDQEVKRTERRNQEIGQRLTEIARKGERLQRFVARHPESSTLLQDGPAATPLPVHAAPNGSIRRRVLSY